MRQMRIDKRAGRKAERGAALLTTLLVATLLLAAGGALILATGMQASNAVDSTAEMQAYYGAEAGLQAAMNALRGNYDPRTGMAAGSKITFANAVDPTKSNLPSDTATNARLSGWLPYTYPADTPSTDWRVPLTDSYSSLTGIAYSVTVSRLPGDTNPEPIRLLVRSTGYGPKGAVKRLEAMVMDYAFDFSSPSTILVIGDTTGVPTPMTWSFPTSNAKNYSGVDHAGTGYRMAVFGFTLALDKTLADTDNSVQNGKGIDAAPNTTLIANADLPWWVQTPANTRTFMADLQEAAQDRGRYFKTTVPAKTDFGTEAHPVITFVDNNVSIQDVNGAGLLVVTGNLDMSGDFSFKGLILVIGNGYVTRGGGGSGLIWGSMVIAKVNGNNFKPTTFNGSGGGDMDFLYDSTWIRRALESVGPRAKYVREY